jgi:hypothetical protein
MSIISVPICAVGILLCLRFVFLTTYPICALMGIAMQRILVLQPLLFIMHGVESIAKFNLYCYKVLYLGIFLQLDM